MASSAKRGDVGGVSARAAAEDRGAGDERVGAGGNGALCRLGIDTTVDLQRNGPSARIDAGARRFDLPQLAFDEALPAEAWIDAHDEDEVDEVEQVVDGIDGGAGVEHHAGAFSERANELQRAMNMRPSFGMHGDPIRTGFGECLDVRIDR